MKNYCNSLLSILITSIILTGCQNTEENLVTNFDGLKLRTDFPAKEVTPGIIPGDAKIYEMRSYPGKYKWRDFAAYLNSEIDELRGEPYFDNLEWMAIAVIIEDQDFLANASILEKDEIWAKIENRKSINNPQLVYNFLKSYSPPLEQKTLANRLRHMQNNLEENFDESVQKEMLMNIHSLMIRDMYDRWGQPLFDLK